MDIRKESKKYYGLDNICFNTVSEEYYEKFFNALKKLDSDEIYDILINIIDWHTKEELSEGHLASLFSNKGIHKLLNSKLPPLEN